MRKHYIDNIRNFTILLLFPVHTFMVWNDFGSRFYIWEGENKILSTCIVLVTPWFTPMLFVLAGISARYSGQQCTKREFIAKRRRKLLLPFLSGMILLAPPQALYARKYFDGYDGSYLGHLNYFFTHVTDFSGYDGAFSPGHLWFILYLFLISMAALPLRRLLPYEKIQTAVGRLSVFTVLLFFLPVWVMYYIGNFGGFSIGKNFMLYLIGYYVLSHDSVTGKLEQNRKWILGLWAAGMAALAALYYRYSYYGDLWVNAIGWVSVLALLLLGKGFFDKQTKFTVSFNRASYPIYILHQPVLVALAYYVLQAYDAAAKKGAVTGNGVVVGTGAVTGNGAMVGTGAVTGNGTMVGTGAVAGKALLICTGSFLLTMGLYCLLRKIPAIRTMVGIK